MRARRAVPLLLALACAACGSSRPEPGVPVPRTTPPRLRLPEVPPADGPLRITVAYPPVDAQLTARDSSFVFGTTGTGEAVLSINGTGIEVAPNGAFLAFVPVPANGVYAMVAATEEDTVRLDHVVRVPPLPAVPATGATILGETALPTGAIALPAGELVDVEFLGTSGGRASVALPGGARVPLVERALATPNLAAADFSLPGTAATVSGVSRYVGVLPAALWVAHDTSVAVPTIGGAEPVQDSTAVGPRAPVFELVVGRDTARFDARVNLRPLSATSVVIGTAQPPDGASHDWTARGRPATSGPFHWFFPPGTRLTIDGERDGFYRVRLTEDLATWVATGDVRIEASGTPPPPSIVPGVRLAPDSGHVDLRIALPALLPFRVDADGRTIAVTVYGATSAVNFLQYGALDPLIARASWSQPADRVFQVRVELTEPVWGWLPFYDETGALVVRIRRPPRLDAEHPLDGLRIVVDAGHPPGGAIGPTGLTEAEANLAVALRLKPHLEEAGAIVLMTRTDSGPVDLGARPRMATEWNGHLLLSIHNNAFPDGVNPFVNNGSSVYYYQPQAIDLARHLLYELVLELGTRDIGLGRADLALVRPTWMPAVLSETLFLMVPRHEAALRDPLVQERIARAHLRALDRFLRERAAAQPRR